VKSSPSTEKEKLLLILNRHGTHIHTRKRLAADNLQLVNNHAVKIGKQCSSFHNFFYGSTSF